MHNRRTAGVGPSVRAFSARTFSSLRHRNVRIFFLGQVISDFGTWFQLLAVPWTILELTHSSSAVGIGFALQSLPMILLGPWAGLLVDRVDKRVLMYASSSLAGTLSLGVGVFVLKGTATVPLLYGLAVATGLVNLVNGPARRAFITELVDRGDLSNAVSLGMAEMNLARVLSPSVAGLTIAAVGSGWCFVINAISFAAVIVAVRALRTDELFRAGPIAREPRQIRQGFAYAWHVPIVRLTLLMSVIIGVFTMQYLQVVIPVLVTKVFHAGPGALGQLFVLAGVGALIGSLAAASRERSPVPVLAGATVTICVACLGCGLAPTVAVESFCLMFLSGAVMVFMTFSTAACQLATEPHMQGRIAALSGLALQGSMPVGGILVGVTMATFGARAGMYQGATGALVATLIALRHLKRPAHDNAVGDRREVLEAASDPSHHKPKTRYDSAGVSNSR